jgi:hypothetical protein
MLIAWIRSMAELLPHNILKERGDHAHFTLASHLDEIFGELVSVEESKAAIPWRNSLCQSSGSVMPPNETV